MYHVDGEVNHKEKTMADIYLEKMTYYYYYYYYKCQCLTFMMLPSNQFTRFG